MPRRKNLLEKLKAVKPDEVKIETSDKYLPVKFGVTWKMKKRKPRRKSKRIVVGDRSFRVD